MRYLCLIYQDEKEWQRLPPSETEAVRDEYLAFIERGRAGGIYLDGNRLQPTETATTVRIRNGRLSTTDGPLAETKEQLGGYMLIEARDLDEAIRLAGRIPSARYGSVEIRPVRELGLPGR